MSLDPGTEDVTKCYYNFDQRIALAKTLNEFRHSPPMGAVGLVEFRNLLAFLFPEFDAVRDEELDDLIRGYVSETMQQEARDPFALEDKVPEFRDIGNER